MTVNDKQAETKLSPEEILEVLFAGQELDEYDYYYANQTDDKVFVGFLRIKSLCQHCGQIFPEDLPFINTLKLSVSQYKVLSIRLPLLSSLHLFRFSNLRPRLRVAALALYFAVEVMLLLQ